MKIANCQSCPGKIVRTMFVVREHSPRIEFPLWIAEGAAPGRTMLLSCAVHGDEMNAIATLQRFVQRLDLFHLHGCLILLPIVNLSGYRANKRHVPEDDRDLNRCFPGDPNGTPGEQLADALFHEIVPHADVGVDIHDSGKQSVLLPHPRILRDETPDLQELAAMFGTDFIMTSELPPGYEGVLPVEARRRYGISFFTVEVGGGTILWEPLIEQGVTGLFNLLVYCEMLPGQILLPERQFFLPGRDDLVRPAPIRGLLERHVELGQRVTKGQRLVTIEDPLTLEQAEMCAPMTGIVNDLNLHARVDEGDDVVGVIGLEMDAEGRSHSPLGDVQVRVNVADKQIRLRGEVLGETCVRLLC